MFRGIDKTNPVFCVLQERRAGVHIAQNAGFTFLTQGFLDAAQFGHTRRQRGGFVGVELIGNEHPFCLGVGRYCGADMGDKIGFRAGVTQGGADHLAGGHLKVRDQGLRAVPGVLEFVQFQLARRHRLVRVYPLQGLNAGFFVNTDHMHTRFVQFLGLVIQFTDRPDVLPEGRFVLYLMVQPVLNPMRFQIRLILKNARHCWLIWSRQYPA